MRTYHSVNHGRHEAASLPTALLALLVLLTFLGLSGVAGGVGLVGAPTGAGLGIPLEWLHGSPFANYFAPGLVLLIALGVLPLFVVAGLWLRAKWSRPAAASIGAMVLIWLVFEVAIIGYQPQPPFQLVFALVGIAVLTLSLRPSVRTALNLSA